MARTYHTYDLIIIGAGSAGISALKEARKHTDNVLLIHDGPIGTLCARAGCMPSKSLIHAAKLYDSRKKMPEAGILGSEGLRPDIPAILQTVREKRDYFVGHMEEEVKELEQHIVYGAGRFESPTKVRGNGNLYHTKATIIATGSTPFIPPEYRELEPHILTTDTLFEHRELPKRMAVVGLGAIGLEMAQALAKLDIDITAISPHNKIGVVSDPDINEIILQALAEDMKVWLDTEPNVQHTKEGIRLYTSTKEVTVDSVFLATGRRPNLGKLGLKRLGVPTNGHGVPHFNRYTMQIPGFPIYMAGDVTDERAILHEAIDEGRRAAYHALHGDKGYSPRYAQMQIIFTKPVISVVGDTEYTMRHDHTIVGEANFEHQGRATIENRNFGKIRLFANEEDGRFRGAEIMAPDAEHAAHFLGLALTHRMSVHDMLEAPFYHPTLEEALQTALKDAAKHVKDK